MRSTLLKIMVAKTLPSEMYYEYCRLTMVDRQGQQAASSRGVSTATSHAGEIEPNMNQTYR